MAEQTEQLESLNTHRQFFYLLSLYGCYDKNNLKTLLNKSKSTIDTEIRLLKYYIEEGKRELKTTDDKTLTYAIPYHRYGPCENELVNLFRQKNFTTNQINYDFLLLFVLTQAKTPLSLTQCLEEIEKISSLQFLSEDSTLSPDAVRDALKEFSILDFITITENNNKKLYSIKENLDFSKEHWVQLHQALSFFKNHGYLNSLGYFCQENVQENLYHQQIELNKPQDSPFAFKRHFPHTLLEDDIALQLMQAWEECVLVSFQYKEEGEEKRAYKVAPLKIIVNPGRQHLLAFDLQEKKPISVPLWRLEKVEKLDGSKKKQKRETFDLAEYESTLALLKKSWSMTRLHLVKDPLEAPTIRVDMDFRPDPSLRTLDGKPLLWCRLEQEKRQGTVTVLNEQHYVFSISVIEPREMIPWIRSFGAQATLRPSKEHNLEEILLRHRKELAETYGLIPPSTK